MTPWLAHIFKLLPLYHLESFEDRRRRLIELGALITLGANLLDMILQLSFQEPIPWHGWAMRALSGALLVLAHQLAYRGAGQRGAALALYFGVLLMVAWDVYAFAGPESQLHVFFGVLATATLIFWPPGTWNGPIPPMLLAMGLYFGAVTLQAGPYGYHPLYSQPWYRILILAGASSTLLGLLFWFLGQVERGQKRLEAQIRHQTQVFALLAHDVRGPLGTYETLLQLWQDRKDFLDPAEQTALVEDMRRQAGQILGLTDALLDYGRSLPERSRFFEPLELNQLIQRAQEPLAPLLTDKRLRWCPIQDPPLTLLSQPVLLEAILRNLMVNAVKFARPGSCVEVTWQRRPGRLHLLVSNEGAVIAPEAAAAWARGEILPRQKGTAGEDGHGLGLMLCRDFARRLGGELYLEAWEAKGTRARVDLPYLI